LVNEGTADRVRFQWVYEGNSPIIGKYRSKNPFSGTVGVSLNRYGVEDDNSVADSIKLLAELVTRSFVYGPGYRSATSSIPNM